MTDKGLAPGSYHADGRKTPLGQLSSPSPDGELWFANGIYPGWQVSGTLNSQDPRESEPSPEEIGRGPIAESLGRFGSLRLRDRGAVLSYTIGGTQVQEQWSASAHGTMREIQR